MANPRKTNTRSSKPTPPKATLRGKAIAVKPTTGALAERVSIDDAGRIVVPAKMRKALGIEGGQALSIRLDGNVIQLQTLKTAIETTQTLARQKRSGKASVVDAFIKERRVEAEKEA